MTIRVLLLLALALPISVAGQELTAIGFVEDNIRLAFVRTNKGWQSSCFFEGQDRAMLRSDGSECARNIMAWPWQAVDATGRYTMLGPLTPIKHRHVSDAGLSAFTLPAGTELKYDQNAEPRFTWMGESAPPLLAVPSGTYAKKLPSEPGKSPNQDVRTQLIKQYFTKDRIIYKCDPAPDYTVHKRPAQPGDVLVTPVRTFLKNTTFYEVSMNLPKDSQCDIVDPQSELMAVKGGQAVNLTEPFRDQGGAFSTSLVLFNGFLISTQNLQDTIFLLFIGGYNRDGYALVDSELNIKAVSMWGYH